jgi:hypothetical protein
MDRWHIYYICVLIAISLLVPSCEGVKVSHDGAVDPKERFLAVLDTLLQQYGVTHSPQLQNCFTESEKQFLWPILVNITKTGLQAGTI